MEKTLRPGMCLKNGKIVVSVFDEGALLSDGTVELRTENLVPSGETCEEFSVAYFVLPELIMSNMAMPQIADVNVGDVLVVIDDKKARLITVAVVDRPNATAYDRQGQMIPLGSWYIANTGWHSDEKDLLTDEGKRRLGAFYC